MDFSAYEAMEKAVERLATEAAPANKQALFEALKAAGIETVIVRYDGEGDEGQMGAPEGFASDDVSVDLPTLEIPFTELTWDGPTTVTKPRSVTDVIERMAWDFLGRMHRGWENNEGGFGTFTFDAAARTITLDHAECYVQHEHYHHEL